MVNPVGKSLSHSGQDLTHQHCRVTHIHLPATSTPAERVFSTAGLTVAKLRSCLSREHVNMLVFHTLDRWPGVPHRWHVHPMFLVVGYLPETLCTGSDLMVTYCWSPTPIFGAFISLWTLTQHVNTYTLFDRKPCVCWKETDFAPTTIPLLSLKWVFIHSIGWHNFLPVVTVVWQSNHFKQTVA